MNNISKRESNFELLRIICMLLIIWGHLINKYSVNEPILGVTYLETRFLKSFTIVAVNVFILISGYFSISFKLPRILKLGQQTWFYSITLLILTISFGWHSISYYDITYFVPIFSKRYWFITYICNFIYLIPMLK